MLEIWDGSQLGDKLYVEIWNDNTPAPDFLIGRHEYPLEEALLCGRRPQENVVHLRQADDNRLCGSEHSAPGNDVDWTEDKQMQVDQPKVVYGSKSPIFFA